jgi:Trk-type K+ transport system membrane component
MSSIQSSARAKMAGLTMAPFFTGLGEVTAFTALIARVNDIGPGLGDVGPALNCGGLADLQAWVCTFAMLLGQLELLSVLVLFTPVPNATRRRSRLSPFPSPPCRACQLASCLTLGSDN